MKIRKLTNKEVYLVKEYPSSGYAIFPLIARVYMQSI